MRRFVCGLKFAVVLAIVGGLCLTPGAGWAQEPIQVTDALGRTLTFETVPQRIVIAGKATFMIVDAIYLFPEATQRVVAMPGGNIQFNESFLALIDPTFASERAFLEGNIGPEQVAPLQPDVVLLKSFLKSSLGDPLEQIGIPVVYLELEVPERYDADLRTLGQLLDNADRAQALIDFYGARKAQVAAALANLDAAAKPRTLMLYYTSTGGSAAFNVAPTAWIQTQLVELARGSPVWTEASDAGGWTVVNFEQIAAWHPEKIFIIHYSGDSLDVVRQLQTDSVWGALPAVQNGELYGFPADFYSWDQPDPRWILGLRWLAGKLHPERFADLDMTAELNAFYALYGLSEATVASEIAPTLKGSF